MANKPEDILNTKNNDTNTEREDALSKNDNVKTYQEAKYDKSTSDANSTFFEKFERTKKDLIKEKKAGKQKALRSVKLKNKILGFENKLRDDDFIKNSWIGFITLSVLFIAYACVCLGFLATKFNGTTDAKWSYANYYGDMTKTIVVFSSIIVIIIPIPYIYLMGTWFVGINGVHKSKGFYITNFVVLLIALVLTLLVIPMSSIIFDCVINFRPLGNTNSGDSGSGDGDTTTQALNAFSMIINKI